MAAHHLTCTPTTTHWGFLDASLPDVLCISPGDRVRIDTVSGAASRLPADRSRFPVLPDHLTVIKACHPYLGPHILTGPIGIRGAEPGDVLRIQIERIELRQNWGWNEIARGDGLLPELEGESEVITLPIDIESGDVLLPWGGRVAAAPFFGVLAVKPPTTDGAISSLIPGVFGGNVDSRLLRAGTQVCFPIHSLNAGVSVGDGHALQGDGEVVGTAVETALTGEFTFELEKNTAPGRFPYAWVPGGLLTLAMDEDLDRAAEEAVRQAVALLNQYFTISKRDAYRHCSLRGNLAISQLVNVKKGVHFVVSVEELKPSAHASIPRTVL
jgi:acetamidase/formamidase